MIHNFLLLQIQHQYTLTDEQGPAHKKTFFVKLKLGDEEYASSGPSIKKAQHAAAAIALDKTQYKNPPPKLNRNTGSPSKSCVHPLWIVSWEILSLLVLVSLSMEVVSIYFTI